MSFTSTTVKHLFSTPLMVSELPADIAADINPALRQMVLDRWQQSKGVVVSNVGGWQSDDRLPEWGGKPVGIILSYIRQVLDQTTVYLKNNAFHREPIDWKISGWANINRRGHSNVPHTHPGAYWSSVYYVAVGEAESAGGDIEFLDPRGALPKMYCPILHMGIEGYINAGGSEIHKPKEGQCLIFPSWLTHAVMPYIGDGTRISLAFNFSIY